MFPDHLVTSYRCFHSLEGIHVFFLRSTGALSHGYHQRPNNWDFGFGAWDFPGKLHWGSLNEIQGFQNECILLRISDWQWWSRSIEVQPLPAQETVVLSPVWVWVLCCSSKLCMYFETLCIILFDSCVIIRMHRVCSCIQFFSCSVCTIGLHRYIYKLYVIIYIFKCYIMLIVVPADFYMHKYI